MKKFWNVLTYFNPALWDKVGKRIFINVSNIVIKKSNGTFIDITIVNRYKKPFKSFRLANIRNNVFNYPIRVFYITYFLYLSTIPHTEFILLSSHLELIRIRINSSNKPCLCKLYKAQNSF